MNAFTEMSSYRFPPKSQATHIAGLDTYGIRTLLVSAPNPQGVVDVLGDKAENFMLGLDAYGIRNLLMLSKNKDAVRVILAKLRPDLINEQAKKRLISEIRREIRKALKNNKI